jgi:hypothetical protein
VAACRYVDEALPNAPLVLAAGWLERHRIDLVVYGDDFSEETLLTLYQVPVERGMVRVVPYTRQSRQLAFSLASLSESVQTRVLPSGWSDEHDGLLRNDGKARLQHRRSRARRRDRSRRRLDRVWKQTSLEEHTTECNKVAVQRDSIWRSTHYSTVYLNNQLATGWSGCP